MIKDVSRSQHSNTMILLLTSCGVGWSKSWTRKFIGLLKFLRKTPPARHQQAYATVEGWRKTNYLGYLGRKTVYHFGQISRSTRSESTETSLDGSPVPSDLGTIGRWHWRIERRQMVCAEV